MLDAVVLANVLHACPTSTIEDVRRCLNAYAEERYPCTKRSYDVSVKGGQLSKQVRKLVRNYNNILLPHQRLSSPTLDQTLDSL